MSGNRGHEEVVEGVIVSESNGLVVYDPNQDAWIGKGFGRLPSVSEAQNARKQRLDREERAERHGKIRAYTAYNNSFETFEDNVKFYRANFVNARWHRRQSSAIGWYGIGVMFAVMGLILLAAWLLVN